MKIPFVDLSRQYLSIKDEIDSAVSRVLNSGRFILGEEVSSFEDEFADYIGCNDAVGVGSGTDALFLSLQALGIGEGDEVITPSLTFIATGDVVLRAGATPVFVDSSEDYNIDVSAIEDHITDKTRAIIIVHLYGYPNDMEEITEIANHHDIAIIEDCAQATGAEYKGGKVGSLGDIGCFSFFPTKNLGAYGDGGAIVTDDEQLSDLIRSLRRHGNEGHNRFSRLGVKSRLDAIQSAILSVNLGHLDEWNRRRRELASVYNEQLSNYVKVPQIGDDKLHSYYQYTIRTESNEERDDLLNHLKDEDIGCAIYYPVPNHLQDVFAHLFDKPPTLPVCEKQAGEVLSLPIYPLLTDEEQERVIEAIRGFYS